MRTTYCKCGHRFDWIGEPIKDAMCDECERDGKTKTTKEERKRYADTLNMGHDLTQDQQSDLLDDADRCEATIMTHELEAIIEQQQQEIVCLEKEVKRLRDGIDAVVYRLTWGRDVGHECFAMNIASKLYAVLKGDQ